MISSVSTPVLELRDVLCGPPSEAPAANWSIAFAPASFNLLLGAPGCGQAALLRVLGLLDAPRAGEVLLEGRPTAALSEAERESLRNQRCGFVFSGSFLLPAFSALENVAMPLFKISRVEAQQARERTEALLDFVGLSAVAQEPTEGLAPFAQHCVSLARALGNEPAVVLVESLQANLPLEDVSRFAALLRQAAERYAVTVIASAWAEFAVEKTDRVIEVVEGALRRDSSVEQKPVA